MGRHPPPAGGLTEVWFTNRSAMRAAMSSPAGLAASAFFAEDESQFIHPPAMSAFLAQETLGLDVG